jgi:hypothetical protein
MFGLFSRKKIAKEYKDCKKMLGITYKQLKKRNDEFKKTVLRLWDNGKDFNEAVMGALSKLDLHYDCLTRANKEWIEKVKDKYRGGK